MNAAPPATPAPAEGYDFALEGMTCGACVARVERVLARAAGGGQANLATGTARVPRSAAAGPLDAALTAAGYPPRHATVTLDVTEMTCASCVARVERALAARPGVLAAGVNLALGTATVEVLEGAQTPAALAAVVSSLGYPAKVRSGNAAPPPDEASGLRRRALTAAALTAPVFLAEMGAHVIPGLHHLLATTIGLQTLWLLQGALTLAVLAGPGRAFFARGIAALRHGGPDMNTLVAMGTAAAFLYSAVATLAPSLLPQAARAVYFEAACVIVTLVLVGRWIEAWARNTTGDAIRHLIALTPRTARVERDGTVTDLPVEAVVPGDLLHLRPGERVAVDGTVEGGTSHVDEAMLTGEPVPVAKAAGDAVTGGTLNGTGALTYRARAVGADTVLAQIVAMVAQAQADRLPVQDLVNRIAAWFVPAVLVAATVTVALWLLLTGAVAQALVAGVAVLIVACPCAMGLAVPAAIVVGTGRGAELGILFRRGAALQVLAGIRTVAFDKTGTLTLGHPALTAIRLAPGWTEGEAALLRIAASVEAASEHPLAAAVVAAARDRGLVPALVDGFAARVGHGAMATVEGRCVVIGAARMLAAEGIDTAPLDALADAMATGGATPVLVAVDGRVAGVLGLSDPVKPTAAAAVAALRAQGVAVALVTGDRAATAAAVARGIGITRVVADVLPGGKVAALDDLRRDGPVAFVGDGLNDAPVLAAADVGLAVGSGTDVAIAAADVVLMRGDPLAVATAVTLARRTMGVIRQNLFWAFAYNVALIPVAAGALVPFGGPMLSPMLAAGAMAASSLAVMANALRLRAVTRRV